MSKSTSSKAPLRIGGASAFWGDSAIGIDQLVACGEVDVLVFDYLAELTMSLLARARVKEPEAGYAGDFVTGVTPHLATIAQRGIKLLSNAGGMNAQGCARALRAAAEAAGVKLNVVVVEGDDLLGRVDEVRAAGVTEMFNGSALPERMTSLNAYLGAQPIAAALVQGADVVITGRCVDSALALGALMHHFGWQATDYDRLAAGSLVGHLLECTTQTTGGLYTDWLDIRDEGLEIGYPIAVCEADGSFVLTKPSGTGGLIAPAVVSEQMLYEIGDPSAYLLPDVRCDFTAVTVEPDGVNRVRFSGARGSAPTGHYKVSATFHDGHRVSSTLTIVGDDAVTKAQRVGEAILARTRRLFAQQGLGDYKGTQIEVLGSELPSFGAQARAQGSREVVLRLACWHESSKALSLLAREFAPFGTAGAPGTTGFSGRPKAAPVFRLFSFLWPKERVAIHLTGESGEPQPFVPVPPPLEAAQPQAPLRYAPTALPAGARRRVKLSQLAVARSGDKGDTVNVAIIARHPVVLPAIAQALTAEAVKAWFAHLVGGSVARFDVPGVYAFNFLLQNALAGGGSSSLRNDPLGKTFGQVLLDFELDVPAAWLDQLDSGR
ncbi:MAG: acyclic terpene utilization AtuA family protein [Burkholderiales bacterium]